MGVYLNEKELYALGGMPHAAITLYVMATRPRMNYETGIVGRTPRISWRALTEWCYVEPDAHGGGGARPIQLSLQQIRRLVARLEKVGLIVKETIADQVTGREYIELFLPLASLKKPASATVATPQASAAPTPRRTPAKAMPDLPRARAAGHTRTCQRGKLIAANRRASVAIARRATCGNSAPITAKIRDFTAPDTCAKIAPDRGSDSLKPSTGGALQAAPDRAPDIHQRSTQSKKPLPPTPFSAPPTEALTNPEKSNSVVVGGVFNDSRSNPNIDATRTALPAALPDDPLTAPKEFAMAFPLSPPRSDSVSPGSIVPLIWPICIHETQKIALLQHLATSAQPQALLDELAGAHQAGIIRSSPIGYLKGLLRRESEGGFIPERGIAILQTREAFKRHEDRKQKPEPAPMLRRPATSISPQSPLGKIMAKLPIGKST